MALQELAQAKVNFKALEILLNHLALVTVPNSADFKLRLQFIPFLVDAVHAASKLMKEYFSTLQNIIQIQRH
jgi:hypothetical protein